MKNLSTPLEELAPTTGENPWRRLWPGMVIGGDSPVNVTGAGLPQPPHVSSPAAELRGAEDHRPAPTQSPLWQGRVRPTHLQ